MESLKAVCFETDHDSDGIDNCGHNQEAQSVFLQIIDRCLNPGLVI